MMYWIYLIIFILAVLAPEIIQKDLYFLGEERAEELMILLLLAIGFTLYLIKEKQLFSAAKEKTKIQKEAHHMTRDLTNSYLYIGEANRKLEILKHIALGIPEVSNNVFQKKSAVYDSIIEAIHILGKSNNFVIRFIDLNSKTILKEIKSKEKISFAVDNEEVIKKINSFSETRNHFIFISPTHNRDTIAIIIIAKRNQQHKIEDPEIIKAIAAQALCVFCSSGEKMA